MNHFFHVIWNPIRKCFVVVSELLHGTPAFASIFSSFPPAILLKRPPLQIGGGRGNPSLTKSVFCLFCSSLILFSSFSTAHADHYVAGPSNSAQFDDNVVGTGNTAKNSKNLRTSNNIFGDNNTVDGFHSNSFGGGNKLYGDLSNNLSEQSILTGNYSTALSTLSQLTGNNSVLMGYQNVLNGNNSFLIGSNSDTTGNDVILLGSNSHVTTDNSILIGNNTTANQTNTVAIGNGATVNAQNSIAIGQNTVVDEENAVGFGNRRIIQVAKGIQGTDVANVSQTGTVSSKDASLTLTASINTDGSTNYDLAIAADGQVESNNARAVSGDTIYNEVRPADGNYVQENHTTAENLTAIDTQVKQNADSITNLQNGEGFTDAGNTYIKNLSKDAVQLQEGDRVTITSDEDTDGNKTYTISANNNGTATSGDTNLISGNTLYQTVEQLKAENLIQSDTHTITIGNRDASTKVDITNGNGEARVLTGVATDATDATSAANVGYVNTINAQSSDALRQELHDTASHLQDNIDRTGAKAAALAALHPLDYDPENKLEFAGGYGHYQNADAAAVAAYYHPDENVMLSFGITVGDGSPMYNVGVTFKLGPKSEPTMSRTRLSKELREEQAKNSQLSNKVETLENQNITLNDKVTQLETAVRFLLNEHKEK